MGTSEYGILVDIGCSYKCTCAALLERGIAPEDICAIAVTHTHTDHTSGLKTFLKKHPVPVIASRITLDALTTSGIISETHPTLCADSCEVSVRGIKIEKICTSHDCDGSAGYIFTLPDERRFAIFTDLGYISDDILSGIKGSDLVMLESNHDVRMLQNNPNYTYMLKRRILSDVGHLSNDVCAATAADLVESGTTRLILGHLSQENNMPELAYQSTYSALCAKGMEEGSDYILRVAGTGTPKMMVF